MRAGSAGTLLAMFAVGFSTALDAQSAEKLVPSVREFVSVAEPLVAIINVKLLDGTGAAAREDQTIIIRDGRIAEVGPSSRLRPPQGARVMRLAGHTVIPGLVGLHNHLFYMAAGGRAMQMSYTAPRLYLASGVTTIRTTGGRSPYAEINTRAAIDAGRVPGPRIHLTTPYLTGGSAGSAGSMAEASSPEAARRFVAYWADEGMEWVKVYTTISRAELAAAIREAHARGMKVTGHICSVSFREAVELGIDNIEHGLFTMSDFTPDKAPDTCPSNYLANAAQANPTGREARDVIRAMVDRKVALTTTVAIYETLTPATAADDTRSVAMMTPAIREAYLDWRRQIASDRDYEYTRTLLRNALEFDRAFFAAGGLLAAGVDPTGTGGALPGFGDQRNYELLVEVGFTPPQAVQVMSANGAKVLGVFDRLGSVEQGKIADLVVLRGDLAANPAVIRNTTVVFKDGVGYDSARLIEAVKGRIGID